MEIVDAWMQHPGPEFIRDPMFDSLRRCLVGFEDLGLDEATQRLFLADNARRVFRLAA